MVSVLCHFTAIGSLGLLLLLLLRAMSSTGNSMRDMS
jgi:hypothetical protein